MDNVGLFFAIFSLKDKFPNLDNLMIFGAEYLIYVTIILMIILGIKGNAKEKKALILAILSIPIVVIMIKIVHIFFYEPRPFVNFHFHPLINNTIDASFPSRHTSIVSTIAFAYTYYKSKWAPVFLLSLLWVGISRIYVGVHYPLDIVGGFLVGILSLTTALKIKKLLFRQAS